jgi:hypothetical protein
MSPTDKSGGGRIGRNPLEGLTSPPPPPAAAPSAAARLASSDAMTRTSVYLRDRHRDLVDELVDATGGRRSPLDLAKIVRALLDALDEAKDEIPWESIRSEADLRDALARLTRPRLRG